ncbi:MAG: polysaccharide deacetylase family protein [Betaproteobacteria bacterium]|nr:polysaccharide deacetylase family protein [Betaproteobacteria bacterium]
MKFWLLPLVLASHLTVAAPIFVDRAVVVTFDDLPFTSVPNEDDVTLENMTHRLLQSLQYAGVPAVGFVNENKLYREGNLDIARVSLLRSWIKAGFDLGNHTFSHLSINRVPLGVFEADLLRGEIITRPLMHDEGRTLRWFRPPFLHIGKTTADILALEGVLHEHGYTLAPVTVNNSEWQFAAAYAKAQAQGDAATANRIGAAYVPYMGTVFTWAERLSDDLFGHAIPQVLLLHANSLNADYLADLADMLKQRGYRFISLAEALKYPAYSLPLNVSQLEGESWLERWSRDVGLRPSRSPSAPGFILKQAGRDGRSAY